MGFFVKASVQALKEMPEVNAEIDGTDIIYKNYYHVGIAVGTDRGLVVPVVRDAFVEPTKVFRHPDAEEREALVALDRKLASLPADADGETIQSAVLDVARAIPRYQDANRKGPDGGPGVSLAWFAALYQILLGQERGPRFGSFAAIYGIPETRALIAKALAGELVA
jgi:hypothetical protein